jgi:hypothetical protein
VVGLGMDNYMLTALVELEEFKDSEIPYIATVFEAVKARSILKVNPQIKRNKLGFVNTHLGKKYEIQIISEDVSSEIIESKYQSLFMSKDEHYELLVRSLKRRNKPWIFMDTYQKKVSKYSKKNMKPRQELTYMLTYLEVLRVDLTDFQKRAFLCMLMVMSTI